MRIEKCNFCSSNVYPGKGTVFVRNDARMFRFCRKKCRLAFMKKKNPTRTKWTKAYRISKQKELSTNISAVFEKRRIVMSKYEADAMQKSLQKLPELLKINQKKKDHHILKRLAVGSEDRKKIDLSKVENKMHLIRAPHAKDSEDESDDENNMEDEDEDEEVEEIMEVDVSDIVNQKDNEKLKSTRVQSEKIEIHEME